MGEEVLGSNLGPVIIFFLFYSLGTIEVFFNNETLIYFHSKVSMQVLSLDRQSVRAQQKYTSVHSKHCVKYDTKYNFLFVGYVNIKKENINETRRYKGQNLQKKSARSEIRTSDLSYRSSAPITACTHLSLQRAPQNKVYGQMQIYCYLYEEKRISSYYYMISTSNYENQQLVAYFFLGFMF